MALIKNKKIAFLISLLLFIAALYFGYYTYQKGPINVSNGEALPVKAEVLYQAFSADSIQAGATFGSNILLVEGLVSETGTNAQKQKVIKLQSGTSGASINCTMDKDPGAVKTGSTIFIRGLCTGIGTGDVDLGIPADVYLTRCLLIPKSK